MKAMPLEIVSYRFKREHHQHKCPMCKKTVIEPNDVCAKVSGDHIYPCIPCLGDQRRRFSDLVLDAYLEPDEMERFKNLSPDHVSDDLDDRDEARRRDQIEELDKKVQENPEAYRQRTPEELAQEKHAAIEEMKELATILTEDEIMEEVEKIKEDEKI